MKNLQKVIQDKQQILADHPFFKNFESPIPFSDAMTFVPKLTFWVMTFQDILRLNEKLVRDEHLKHIARHHRREDLGHDSWFLHDVTKLGLQSPNATDLFDPTQTIVRDASFALISEVFSAKDDLVRIVLVLALEGAGHVFFRQVTAFVDAHGHTNDLKYFSMHHLAVEEDHELFEHETEHDIESIKLAPQVEQECLAAIGRVFNAFDQMFNGLMQARDTHPAVSETAA